MYFYEFTSAYAACGGTDAQLAPPCFDPSRCLSANGTANFTVYVHSPTCSLQPSSELLQRGQAGGSSHDWNRVWRSAVHRAGALVETPQEACLIAFVGDMYTRYTQQCVPLTPTWRRGLNHVLIDLTDRARGVTYWTLSPRVAFAKSNLAASALRAGYDVAVALPPKGAFAHLEPAPAARRRYLLTFCGTVYPTRRWRQHGWERMHLLALHAPADGVVVVGRCSELRGDHARRENADRCAALRRDYDAYDYGDLLNTTFALVPAGRQPATYRLLEAMSAGAIPVVCADDYALPFPRLFDWDAIAIVLPALAAPEDVLAAVRAVSDDERERMHRGVVDAYARLFSAAGKGRGAFLASVADRTLLELRENVQRAVALEGVGAGAGGGAG
ncbi:exostosin family-domain-containing protein [Tribonema minus]|uniref:Exostosin family-domain-containing protein n=1 Tax=Tribonema minus TaxID=303371 RepID=A0A836CBB1_9STRA|nr:exostosin family-domain-containing protein [Tribonema minus]